MRTHRRLLAALLVTVSLFALTGFTSYLAQPQTMIKVAPQTLKVRVGEETTIELALEKVSRLYGAQLHLRFDPEVLEVVDADPSQDGIQIEPGTLPAPDFIVQNAAKVENIRAMTDATREYGCYPSAPPAPAKTAPTPDTVSGDSAAPGLECTTRTSPGVCVPWEEKAKEYEKIMGDKEIVKKVWEEVDDLAYQYVWFCLALL